jgi:hypothetical protein
MSTLALGLALCGVAVAVAAFYALVRPDLMDREVPSHEI